MAMLAGVDSESTRLRTWERPFTSYRRRRYKLRSHTQNLCPIENLFIRVYFFLL